LPDGDVTLGAATPSITDNGNANAITIDSAENVGIGVTPEAWHNDYRNLAVGGTGALWSQKAVGTGKAMGVGQNVYYDGSNKYITTDEASRYYQANGVHTFEVAASGSADAAISWTTAMTIDNSGQVTMPLQPAFSVLPASNNATNTDIEVGGSATKVAFGTEIFDVGTNYGNDTFTAPVTGRYVFSANIRFNNMDSAAAYYAVMIQTSNRIYYNLIDPDFGQDTPQWNANMSVLADMDANDTAFVNVYQHTGTEQTDVEHTMSIFTGYLLG
jgi:hypothetical protein